MRNKTNGKVFWNRKHSRQLIFLSTWLGFHYISSHLTQKSIPRWKDDPNLLLSLITLLHHEMTAKDVDPEFVIPKADDIVGQFAIIFRGAPKLRATVKTLAELVVLRNYKVIIWSSLPANQLLLLAIHRALRIGNVCCSSELSADQRNIEVNNFTTSSDYKVFLGSWFVGSCGLNLHPQCHHQL